MADRPIKMRKTSSAYWILARGEGRFVEYMFDGLGGKYPDVVSVMAAFLRGEGAPDGGSQYKSEAQWERSFGAAENGWSLDLQDWGGQDDG